MYRLFDFLPFMSGYQSPMGKVIADFYHLDGIFENGCINPLWGR